MASPSKVGVPLPPPWPPELVPQLVAWLSSRQEEPTELLGGKLVRKAMASFDHGAACGGVMGQLLGVQGPGGPGTRWWLGVEVDVYVGGEGVRPDVVGWRVDRHPVPPPRLNVDRHLGVIVEAPDWVCEVLSTSTASRDRNAKWRAYHRGGVEWYWLVDLIYRTITVYRRNEISYELVELAIEGEDLHLEPFSDTPLKPGMIFLRPPTELFPGA